MLNWDTFMEEFKPAWGIETILLTDVPNSVNFRSHLGIITPFCAVLMVRINATTNPLSSYMDMQFLYNKKFINEHIFSFYEINVIYLSTRQMYENLGLNTQKVDPQENHDNALVISFNTKTSKLSVYMYVNYVFCNTGITLFGCVCHFCGFYIYAMLKWSRFMRRKFDSCKDRRIYGICLSRHLVVLLHYTIIFWCEFR